MANFVNSIGYAFGKLHVGMLCYLCDLWNEGTKDPLQTLLNSLDIGISGHNLRPIREWNSIDLVIFDFKTHRPLIVIEMKVDDHEHETTRNIDGETKKDYQTIIYSSLLPDCEHFLFITLGAGEYFHAPRGTAFRWIKVRKFHEGLAAITSNNSLISSWRDAVNNEIDLQNRAFINDRTKLDSYRTGTWNMYFLGNLKNKLISYLADEKLDVDPTACMYGTRPDTILNFGWSRYPLYMEINNNGKLNLKTNLEEFQTHEAKRLFIEKSICDMENVFAHFKYSRNNRKGLRNSKTLLSFDIGLLDQDGYLKHIDNEEKTKQKILQIIRAFYSNGYGKS